MTGQELQSACLATAMSILNDEAGDQARVGDLELRHANGGAWDAHKHADGILIYVDTLVPHSFPSARLLASYIYKLNQMDATAVDLSDSDYDPADL